MLSSTILAITSTHALADRTFNTNAVIIPASASYQNDCGAVAMYGVVYNVLRANAWLAANGHGTIELYYAFNENKLSPNRCTPTNLNAGPLYTGSTNPVLHNDAKWTDGCDFEVFDNTVTPVQLIDNASATSAAADTNAVTFNTTAKASVFPGYAATTILHTVVAATNVNTVRYLGGSFVVDDVDAVPFLKLIQGTLIAKDSAGNNIDFSAYRTGPNTCTFGTTVGGYVRMHRAKVAFTAPTPRVFSAPPPRLALLATDSGGNTGNVSNNILQVYLRNAGLNFAGSQGCPVGGANVANAAICPSGGTTGQIFDVFDFQDVMADRMSAVDGTGAPKYKMLWAPHWGSTGTSTTPPSANEITALTKLSTYLNGQTGFMAECHAIEAIEGAHRDGSGAHEQGATAGQFQTCTNNGTGGCSAVASPFGMKIQIAAAPSGLQSNCSDPTLATGAVCAFHGYPGDPLSQTADYKWDAQGGSVRSFIPNTATTRIYRPGVLPLISGVSSLDKTKLSTPALARAMIVNEFTSRNSKDNDPAKASILYLSGHDLTGSVSGTKVVLETLLLLGLPPAIPVTTEVSRSSPIITSIGGTDSIVQGAFENITPPPSTPVMNSPAQVAAFRFPDVIGHMRAIPITGVTTTATSLGTLTATFDAASKIPSTASSYAGCGAAAFKGTCRTLFTTTASAPFSRVLLESSNTATLGPIMGSGSTLTAAEYPTLIQRIIAGRETAPSSGVFEAKLGGVDRSTVAVVGDSLTSGTPRPKMVYFGATDGMLHATCGSVLGDCDVLGRELWAFIPRNQLPLLRKNTAKIQGSPRVVDLFGNFGAAGSPKSFKTILLFQSGSGAVGATESVVALDITNPSDPKIVFEQTLPGVGLFVTAGLARQSVGTKNVAFVHTNNGPAAAGSFVTAINIEQTADVLWKSGYTFPNPPRGSGAAVPASGVPGGAVAIDKQASGIFGDVVFGTLYGDLWLLDAANGNNRYGAGEGNLLAGGSALSSPLFRFVSNFHPFGATPAVYSQSGSLYAFAAPGGYVDAASPATALWTTNAQTAVSVLLSTPLASAPLNETSGAPNVAFTVPLDSGDKGFSQATVIGDQLFFTTDSADINAADYGSVNAVTGTVYTISVTGGTATTADAQGGAGSVASSGTAVYASSKDKAQRLVSDAASAAPRTGRKPQVSRSMWLQTL